MAGNAEMPEEDMDLLAGMLDPSDSRPARFPERRPGRQRLGGRGPGAEMGLDQPAERPQLEVAHRDQERVVRGEVPAMMDDDLVTGNRPNVARGASRIPSERMP